MTMKLTITLLTLIFLTSNSYANNHGKFTYYECSKIFEESTSLLIKYRGHKVVFQNDKKIHHIKIINETRKQLSELSNIYKAFCNDK